jgi:transposase
MIVKKLYVVRLSEEERSELTKLVKTGRAPAYRRRHAEILLQADQGQHGPALHDRQIVDKLDVARQTVEKVRKRCVEEGLEAALGRRQRSRDRAPVLDGEGEAQLVAIACSEPPDGRARWTLHLLVDELKRRKIVQTISHETVRKVLKKRDQAVAPTDVVHSAPAGRRLRVRDGASPGGVHPPV